MPFLTSFSLGIKLLRCARMVSLTVWSAVFLLVASVLASGFSGRQASVVGLDVGISVVKIILPLMIVMAAHELFFKEFDRKYYLVSFSHPLSRTVFLLSRFAVLQSFNFLLLFIFAAVLAVVFFFIDSQLGNNDNLFSFSNYLVVLSFIYIDSFTIAALACVLAVVSVTPSFIAVGVLGYTLIARSYGVIVDLLTKNYTLVSDADTYLEGLGFLGYFLPDLGALDIRGAVLYGRNEFLPNDWLSLILGHIGYALALLALALIALLRKRFD